MLKNTPQYSYALSKKCEEKFANNCVTMLSSAPAATTAGTSATATAVGSPAAEAAATTRSTSAEATATAGSTEAAGSRRPVESAARGAAKAASGRRASKRAATRSAAKAAGTWAGRRSSTARGLTSAGEAIHAAGTRGEPAGVNRRRRVHNISRAPESPAERVVKVRRRRDKSECAVPWIP